MASDIGVGGPAEIRRLPPGVMKPDGAIRAPKHEQPERQRVQPREERRQVDADLQRQHQVCEPERTIGVAQNNSIAPCRACVNNWFELLVGLGTAARHGQLGADRQRHQPTDEEEDEAGNA